MMMACPICWKRFFGQPEFWPYRRGDNYICSENCMIVFDVREFKEKAGWIDDHYRKKEEKNVHKITLAQKKKAVEIAIGGGNPLKYLEECGSGNPSAHWYYIKKTLKEKDPQKYAQIPGAEEKKDDLKDEAQDEEEKPHNGLDGFEPFEIKDGRKKVTTCCAPSTRGGVEVPDELPEDGLPENSLAVSAEILEKQKPKKERKPLNYGGYDVSAIRSEVLGEFYYDRKFNSLDWRTAEGEEIGMSPDGWKMLMNELPKIMGILGI